MHNINEMDLECCIRVDDERNTLIPIDSTTMQ
jgi:hypothetical protein